MRQVFHLSGTLAYHHPCRRALRSPRRAHSAVGPCIAAAMNDICRDVSEPITKKLDVVRDLCNTRDDEIDHCWWVINDLRDQLDAEHRLRRRLEDKLAKYKGKQKEESEATMDSPLPRKWQAVGVPPPPMLPAMYIHASRRPHGGSNTSTPKVDRRPWGTHYP